MHYSSCYSNQHFYFHHEISSICGQKLCHATQKSINFRERCSIEWPQRQETQQQKVIMCNFYQKFCVAKFSHENANVKKWTLIAVRLTKEDY